MTAYYIPDLDDPRLEPYRHLRSRNLTRFSNRFIAESRLLVERLLSSDYEVESVLVDEKFGPDLLPLIPESIDTWILAHDHIDQLVGFNFHRGVLACGVRKSQIDVLDAVQAMIENPIPVGVLAIGVQDPENLGVILRTCAGLGIMTCLIGPGTADPLSRRSLRVSMGNALRVGLVEARDLDQVFQTTTQLGVATVATSLQQPSVELMDFQHRGPKLVILGNEAHGLPIDIQSKSDFRVNIRMDHGTDSLNVSVAAGIILHQVTRVNHSIPNDKEPFYENP